MSSHRRTQRQAEKRFVWGQKMWQEGLSKKVKTRGPCEECEQSLENFLANYRGFWITVTAEGMDSTFFSAP